MSVKIVLKGWRRVDERIKFIDEQRKIDQLKECERMRRLLLRFQLTSPFWRTKCSQRQRCGGCDAPTSWNNAVRRSITNYSPPGIQDYNSPSASFIYQKGAESNFFQRGGLRRHSTITISGCSSEQYQLYRHAVTKVIQSPEFKTQKEYWTAQNSWTQENFHRLEAWLLQKKPLSKTDTSQLLEVWDSTRKKWIEVLSNNNINNDANIDNKAGVEIQRKKLRTLLISHHATQRNALQNYVFEMHSSPMSESLSSPVVAPPRDPGTSQSLLLVQFVIHTLVDHCCDEKQGLLRIAILPLIWQKIKEGGVIIKKTKFRRMLNCATDSTFMMSQFDRLTNQVVLFEELIMYYDLEFGENEKTTLSWRYLSLLKQLSSLRLRVSQPKPLTEVDIYALGVTFLIEGGLFR